MNGDQIHDQERTHRQARHNMKRIIIRETEREVDAELEREKLTQQQQTKQKSYDTKRLGLGRE